MFVGFFPALIVVVAGAGIYAVVSFLLHRYIRN
jgi:hypothetical protein